jgi:hypothetical protein
MLLAHRARVAALGTVFVLGGASCADEQHRPPFASATCRSGACNPGAIVGGGIPGGGESDAGTTDSGSGAATIVCHTDSLIELCTGSTACPGLFIDPVAFARCGFRGAGVDVECMCNGNSLCPVAVQTSCSYVASQLSLKTYDEICAAAVSGGCIDVNNLPRGAGGRGGAGGLTGAGGGP